MVAAELNELMLKRRSVFQQSYTGEKVKDEIVKQMITNATLAPNHKMTQPWRFIVFTGDGLKQFAEAQAGVYREVATRDGSFKEDKFQGFLTKPLLSSHIIVVCMSRDAKKAVPEIEETGAVFCAVENMYLTATAYGVGCYLSTGGITYYEEAKKVFGLEPDDRLIGFLHIGMPKEWPKAPKRLSAEEVSQWVVSA